MRPAVFLDRDGVLNGLVTRNDRLVSPRSIDQFHLLPDVPDAVARLKNHGLLIVVVTNQPDIARGWMSLEELETIHAHLRSAVLVDAIYTCCHDDADNCSCRKPKPGLLIQASREMEIDLSRSYMIGDSGKDIDAGQRAGCKTFLIQDPSVCSEIFADVIVTSLQAAVDLIARDFSTLRGHEGGWTP